MSAVDSSPMSVQAGPSELRRRTNLRQSLRAMRENASTAYAPEDFSADRAPEAEPKDLLARLISARDAETGGGMTAKEVRDQVVTIFMAGHETTAQALSWTFYLLSQHPDVEGKLHDELATVLAGRTPRYEDLGELRYTRMVIEESMRLFPPAHIIGRQPVGDDEVLASASPLVRLF